MPIEGSIMISQITDVAVGVATSGRRNSVRMTPSPRKVLFITSAMIIARTSSSMRLATVK